MISIEKLCAIGACTLLASSAAVRAAAGDDGLARFRATYKELVETNTSLSVGDCTLAAQRMAAHLKQAGYPDADVRIFVPEGHPKEGGLIAVLHGTDPKAKAILMLAHVDVVEAKREDWTRDPFTLIEEDGYFYGRGTSDMKAQAAIWVDNMVRFFASRASNPSAPSSWRSLAARKRVVPSTVRVGWPNTSAPPSTRNLP
jgi:acetylornithine deacetylase/succinyl-diaminopimelate desuccinylase-like protein